LLASATASAQQGNPNAAMQAQIDALNKQIQILQTQLNTLNDQAFKSTDSPRVTVNNGRPVITSPKGDFNFAARGRIHLDWGYWDPGNKPGLSGAAADLPDGYNFRRAYLGFTGKAFNDFTYTMTADFGGRINTARLYEAVINYTGIPNLSIDVGEWEPNFTFEDSISSNDIPFIERDQAVNLATGNVAGDTRLAAGFRYNQNGFWVGANVTGNNINQTATIDPSDDQAAMIARVAYKFAPDANSWIHVGADYGYLWRPAAGPTPGARNYSLSERPDTRLGGGSVRFINTGNIDTKNFSTYGAELVASFDSAWLMSEYYHYDFTRRANTAALPDPKFNAYYVGAGFFLTGEKRGYSNATAAFGGVTPLKPFKLDGSGFGAFELVAKYSKANLNYRESLTAAAGGIRGGDEKIYLFGLNWYLNSFVRLMFNYNIIEVSKMTAAGGNGDIDANAFTTRLQFQF
jgi:phosphate-selective porin OprO/OprP